MAGTVGIIPDDLTYRELFQMWLGFRHYHGVANACLQLTIARSMGNSKVKFRDFFKED